MLQLIHYTGALSLDGDNLGAPNLVSLHKHGTLRPWQGTEWGDLWEPQFPAKQQPIQIILLPFPPDNF